MKNITLLTLQQKHPNGSTSHLDSLSLEKTFTRVLASFIENKDDSFVILETVVLCCITIEAIIREKLREINPALLLERVDPVSIAILSDKADKLITQPSSDISDIKTATISVLFDRFLRFYNKTRYKNGIEALFSLRNKILHAAPKNVLDAYIITLMLTRDIFPFIKDYVKVSNITWLKIRRIQRVAYDAFKVDLARKIVSSREHSEHMSKVGIQELLSEKPYISEYEDAIVTDLLCPACKHQSVTIVRGVDFGWTPDGSIEDEYCTAHCRVCELDLTADECEEIADNYEEYFGHTKAGKSWGSISLEPEADITDYLSYDDIYGP